MKLVKKGDHPCLSVLHPWQGKKEAVSLHRSLSKILLKLVVSRSGKHLLSVITVYQQGLLRRSDVGFLVAQLKAQWVIFKTFVLEGQIVPLQQTPVWIKVKSGTGLPGYLNQVVEKWKTLPFWDKILVVTAMRLHKCLVFPVPIDLKTITDPQTKDQITSTQKVIEDLVICWKRLGLRPAKKSLEASPVKNRDTYLNPVNSGSRWGVSTPYGRGLWAILRDLLLAFTDLWLESVRKPITDWYNNSNLVDGSSLVNRVTYYAKRFQSIGPGLLYQLRLLFSDSRFSKKWGGPTLGRLAHFDDIGGKKRYIAIGNWVVQGVLRPLHDILIRCLRSWENDCTYHQEKVFAWYKLMVEKGKTQIYSLDLRSATDRLPLLLQAKIIALLLSNRKVRAKDIARSWEELIRTITFNTKVIQLWKVVSYKVGQGIGLYRSWPAIAITNHVIVRYCGWLVGISNFRDYLILGDDVVIANKKVALKYVEVINRIGVRISVPKSIHPSDLIGLEFASKLIMKEGNLSPLPILLLVRGRLIDKITFISQLVDRVLTDSIQRVPSLESLFVALFGERHWEKLSEIWVHIYFILKLLKMKQGELSLGRIPEPLASVKGGRVTWACDLLCKFEAFRLRFIQLILMEVYNRKITAFQKITKLIRKSIIMDFRVHVKRFLDPLGPEPGPCLLDLVNLIARWLKGPFINTIVEVQKYFDSQEKLNQGASTLPNHEDWTEGDRVFSREELKVIDHMVLLSYGPDKLLKGVYPVVPGLPSSKRVESKASKVNSWKYKFVLRALKKHGV